jgi:hypothetical protein
MKLGRRIRHYLRQFPPYRAAMQWRGDRKFRQWKVRNPEGTYADYYAQRVERTFREGKPHYTLGGRGWTEGHGEGFELDSDAFAKRGLRLWNQILAFGLEPQMRCVDYGCGSLRLGQHAIRYLEAGNYFGIDVVDTFFKEGLKLIDPQLLEAKKPQLAVIDEATIAAVGDWKPDFIFSNAVLQHVPQDELGTYYRRLETMMGGETQAFILFVAAPKLLRVKAMNWAYPPEYLVEVLAAAAPSLRAEVDEVAQNIRMVDGNPRKVLRITRADG